ncbi:MAG: ring-opening amidohydrolase [Alphaproteobacteria bacterium]|nr:ring-opening amidohydrolase [Alphaproteobacteria bacterium]
MSRQAYVTRIPASAPDDTSALEDAISSGKIDAHAIVAILGKTEGNGCVNDFTRAFAVRAVGDVLATHIGRERLSSIAMVMSGGTEGGLSPHWIVFEARELPGEQPGSPYNAALALGRVRTPDLDGEHLGRRAQALMVAQGVRDAMKDAGILHPEDVHYVQVKCPLLTSARIEAVERRNQTTAVRDTLKSMSYSRAASALGVAVALGELRPDDINDSMIATDVSRFATRAATSAGVELLDHEIMVAGMSAQWSGPLAIDHAVMRDSIDIEPAREALARLGIVATGQLSPLIRSRVAAVLAKAEASQSGRIRGNRHVMLDDSDISSTRHARSFAGGALAGLFGFTDLFVSGGAEHQGPDGGGPIAIIVSRD